MSPPPIEKRGKKIKVKNFMEFKTMKDWDDRYTEIHRDGIKMGKKYILDELIEVFINEEGVTAKLLNIIRKSL